MPRIGAADVVAADLVRVPASCAEDARAGGAPVEKPNEPKKMA